ncbi:hypothetical protein Fmac_012216 [Flemingia macrophylla]|uniref:Uncharacterized protein n=1 Tax=Flemingia macrophylla TaxID=520843 RepID=A0ABD1MPN3_9FABA
MRAQPLRRHFVPFTRCSSSTINNAKIKVVGVGDSDNNFVNRMIGCGLHLLYTCNLTTTWTVTENMLSVDSYYLNPIKLGREEVHKQLPKLTMVQSPSKS